MTVARFATYLAYQTEAILSCDDIAVTCGYLLF